MATRRIVELPHPNKRGGLSLEEVLARRRSVRVVSGRALTDAEISQLLWACQGMTCREGGRAAPSAGALYPLEVFLVRGEGLDHYDPRRHLLLRLSDDDLRPALFRAAQAQECLLEPPAIFVIAAVFERTLPRYGRARAERYVHMEAGHAAQNLLLQAASLALGAVPVGAFDDAAVQAVLSLPPDNRPLYLIPVGHPAAAR